MTDEKREEPLNSEDDIVCPICGNRPLVSVDRQLGLLKLRCKHEDGKVYGRNFGWLGSMTVVEAPEAIEDRRLIIAAVGDAAEFEDIDAGPCIILRGSVEAVRAAAKLWGEWVVVTPISEQST